MGGKGKMIEAKLQDIYVRAHTVSLEKKKREGSRQNNEPKWPNYALVFDCESRITADQTLTFGVWRFCELRNGDYIPLEQGSFHDDNGLTAKEFTLLHKYARATKPDPADDGCDRLRLYSRSMFIEEVFGMAIQAKALIVGFNLPFDLSRIAVYWNARTLLRTGRPSTSGRNPTRIGNKAKT